MAEIDQKNLPPRGGSSIARPMQHVGKLRQWMSAGAVLLALLPGLFGMIRPEAAAAQVVTTIQIPSAPGDPWSDASGSGSAVCASQTFSEGSCSYHPWGQRVSDATWIWKATGSNHPAGYVTFSKSFTIPGDAYGISATMYITADNAYDVSFNGTTIETDPIESGSMDLNAQEEEPFSWRSVESYVLNAAPGPNELKVRVANHPALNAGSNHAGLIYRIVVNYSEGVADTTAPEVTVPDDFTVNATGPDGAVVTYAASASDLVDGPITPVCVPASGALFPIGTTTVTCTATDVAGNIGSASFEVTVLGASGQLANLTSSVQGYNLHQGISNSLDTKLSNAQRALDAARAGDLASACGLMGAFINEVEAQADQKLTVPQADILIADASRIAAVLGC